MTRCYQYFDRWTGRLRFARACGGKKKRSHVVVRDAALVTCPGCLRWLWRKGVEIQIVGGVGL